MINYLLLVLGITLLDMVCYFSSFQKDTKDSERFFIKAFHLNHS